MMENQTHILTELYEDEVVCYLADRYHTTPNEVVERFLAQDDQMEEADRKPTAFTLEENEMEIMRGLTKRAIER